MTPDFSLQLLSQMLWTGAWIAAPLLLVVLAVGVLINVLQVVTQIQEMSLSFIPKVMACCMVLGLAGGWMLRKLLAFGLSMFQLAGNG